MELPPTSFSPCATKCVPNSSTSPAKLRRQDTNHPVYKHKASNFKRKLEELTNSQSFKVITSKTGD